MGKLKVGLGNSGEGGRVGKGEMKGGGKGRGRGGHSRRLDERESEWPAHSNCNDRGQADAGVGRAGAVRMRAAFLLECRKAAAGARTTGATREVVVVDVVVDVVKQLEGVDERDATMADTRSWRYEITFPIWHWTLGSSAGFSTMQECSQK